MKSLFRKSVAVFMASIVLFTTMPFALDVHFCDEELVDFSFFQKAEPCGMDQASNIMACENSSIHETSCCKDQQIIKQSQNDIKSSVAQISLEQKVFIVSLFYSYFGLLESDSSLDALFIPYPPPFIERDVQVLHQTFLI